MSLKQIANEVGVSVATVSRVLNQPEYMCREPELADRIRECARTKNYVPNQSARQLKMGTVNQVSDISRQYCIDILLARFDTLDADLFFREVFRFVETELHQQNCFVGEILNVPDISFQQVNKMRSKAQGVIIFGKCPSGLVGDLKKRYQSLVAIDRNPTEYELDEIVCNGSRAAKMAVEYLIDNGHRKIGYIGDCNMESRYMGYYEVLLQHNISLTYDYIVPTNQTLEEGERAYRVLNEKEKKPTAILCANDVTAIGFFREMQRINGRHRKNIYRPAVISIDDIEKASAIHPMLTTVHIPKKDMAHLAVTTLRDRLQGGHKEFIRIELPCHLKVRESCNATFV